MFLRSFHWLLLLSAIFTTVESFSQPTLWGMAREGGATDAGVIYKMQTDGSGFSPVYSFEALNEGTAIGSQGMVLASDGLFYGATIRGGAHDMGVLFSFDPISYIYRKKLDFSPQTGAYSYGALMQASNGKIYGTTQWEGANGYGTLFEYNIETNTLAVKYAWESGNGEATASFGVVEGDDGLLYGTRMTWGSAGKGVIFRYNPSTGMYTERYHFTDDNIGRRPNGIMIKLDDGTFLGVTESGGTGGNGTVFHYEAATNVLTKKADVGGNGAYPVGYLTKHANGKFYGVTQSGGSAIGTLFEYDHSNSTYTKKFSFTLPDGLRPSGKLVAGEDGKLYGKTTEGGEHADQGGTFFSYNPVSNVFTKLHDFGGEWGIKPYGSVELMPDGNIIGSTAEGGAGNSGVLFEYEVVGEFMRTVRTLHHAPEGSHPASTFTQGPAGKLLATLGYGGDHGKGVIFEIDTKTNAFTRLADFTGVNGSLPVGQMVKAADGDYYGVTYFGGDHGGGVLFRFDYTTKQLTPVFHFDDESGFNPEITLTMDEWGEMLYGVTPEGGDNGNGTIFRFDVFGNAFSKIHDFASNYGDSRPGLLLHEGMLYGVCADGGANGYGAIYKIDLSGTQFTVLYDDFHDDAFSPYTQLLKTSDGKIYGTLFSGGEFQGGLLFRFDPQSSQLVVLKNFDASSGKFSYASLTEGKDGKLFGVTLRGGTHDLGTIFSFDPASGELNVIQNFDGANGSSPSLNSLFLAKAPQHLAALPDEIIYSDVPLELPLISDAGFTVRYQTSDDEIFSVEDNLLTMNATGFAMLIASQEGNMEYFPADTVYHALTIALGKPLATTATDISLSGFTAHWTEVYGANAYVLDVSKDNFSTFVAGYEHKSVSNLLQILTGLEADTQYQYRVKAVGASEQSPYSQTITVVTTIPPSAPVALAATDITTTSFTAHWSSVPHAAAYEFDLSTDNFNTFIQPYQAKSLTSLSLEIEGLAPGTSCQYRVRAVNAAGESVFSNIISAATAELQAQQITFDIIPDQKIDDEDFAIVATSSAGLPVIFTTTSSAIQITGTTVEIMHAGSATIRAEQAGNDIFLPAQPVERAFCILPGKPVITASPATDGAVLLTSSTENNNRWFMDNELIDNERSITVTTNGSYTVEVSVEGCTSERSQPYNFVVTSLESEGGESMFSVHPNPAIDFMNITTHLDKRYKLRIIQADGRVVYETEHDESLQPIDVSGFGSGVYLIEVTTGSDRQVLRVMKY